MASWKSIFCQWSVVLLCRKPWKRWSPKGQVAQPYKVKLVITISWFYSYQVLTCNLCRFNRCGMLSKLPQKWHPRPQSGVYESTVYRYFVKKTPTIAWIYGASYICNALHSKLSNTHEASNSSNWCTWGAVVLQFVNFFWKTTCWGRYTCYIVKALNVICIKLAGKLVLTSRGGH